MEKKGDLSINVIIVSVIGLVVLVVLIAIFTGRMSIFGGDVNHKNSCVNDLHGTVVVSTENCQEGFQQMYGVFSDVDTAHKCCVPKTS